MLKSSERTRKDGHGIIYTLHYMFKGEKNSICFPGQQNPSKVGSSRRGKEWVLLSIIYIYR